MTATLLGRDSITNVSRKFWNSHFSEHIWITASACDARSEILHWGSFRKYLRSNLVIFEPPPRLLYAFVHFKKTPSHFVRFTYIFHPPTHTHAHTHYTFRKLTKPWLFIMMWITNYGLLGFFYKKKRHTWQVVCLSCLQILLKSEFFTVLRDGFFQILSYKSF